VRSPALSGAVLAERLSAREGAQRKARRGAAGGKRAGGGGILAAGQGSSHRGLGAEHPTRTPIREIARRPGEEAPLPGSPLRAGHAQILLGVDPKKKGMTEADRKAMPRMMGGAVVGLVAWLAFVVTHSLNTQFEGRKPVV